MNIFIRVRFFSCCGQKFCSYLQVPILLVTIAPPPPEVTILFPLKEKTPTSPKLPVGFPLYSLPKDSAASSTKGIFQSITNF